MNTLQHNPFALPSLSNRHLLDHCHEAHCASGYHLLKRFLGIPRHMKGGSRHFLAAASLLFLCFFIGCSPRSIPPKIPSSVQVDHSLPKELLQVRRVWVHPLIIETTKNVTPSAEKRLKGALSQIAGESLDFELVEKEGALSTKDAVLLVRLTEYRESSGSSLGAESPAQVAFWVSLQDRTGKKLIWEGSFSQIDKDLSQNLLKLKGKGDVRWSSAYALFEAGLKVTLGRLREERQNSFLGGQGK